MSKAATLPALPPLTDDVEQAKADLAELGIARIADALSRDEVTALRERLAPRRRRRRPPAWRSSTAVTAPISGCGTCRARASLFRDLLRHPVVRTFARHVLEGDYCLSSHTANIAGPGGVAMGLHSDQGYAPRDIAKPLAMNVMWMLNDFTDENGATRLVPGSHRWTHEPPRDEAVETVAGVGPAGTALVFDGRVWHGTGANTTADDRRYGVLTYFCRPWMRPQENYTLSTHPAVLDELDDELRALLGLRVWRTLGGVEGPVGAGHARGQRVPDRRLRRPARAPDR